MASIKELIQSIESGDSSFDEKLAAINQMEETLIAMRNNEEQAVNDNVELIVEAIKVMEKKVNDQLEIAKSIVPEKGDKGDRGLDGAPGRDGVNGRDGRDGKDGQNGQDGADGVSVTDAKIDFDGSLIITLSTGREINVGEVVASDLAEKIKVISTMSTNTAIAAITGGTIDNTVIGGTTPAAGTFTEVAVTTATGESSFNENDTITGWLYSGNSFSVSGQETVPTGLFIGSSGTKMYVCGSIGDDVNEYTLSTAWDITTATFVTTFSVSAQDSAPNDIFFKPDGLSMFIMGNTTDTVYQYTLGTAWSVATASYASKSFSVTTQEATPIGVWFKPDGTVMYVVGTSADSVFQYALSTAWDVSTASYGGIFYSFAAQEATANQINLSDDGTKMWVLGATGDDIWEYTLGTAWNVSTAIPVNNFYTGFQDTNPTGLFTDSTAPNRVYMVGSTSDAVYQYYTNNNSLKLDTDNLYVGGDLKVNKNFVAGQNAYVDGNLTVQSALTAGNLTVGTTSVSGTLSSSSTTTLATSTAAQTVSLGAGATVSGSTKAINIGTTGVSGSTTTIAIGSAVSGSLGSIAIQSPTVNIGQTATQFAVTNTASAVNYVQVTGAATGVAPVISTQGSDSNVALNFSSKGTSGFNFYTDSGTSARQFRVERVASSVNFLAASGAAAGGSPSLSVSSLSSDTNIDLTLTPKGTGMVRFGTRTASADAAITGYIEIKDSGGTTRRLAVIG
jgi:hypothetical protein